MVDASVDPMFVFPRVRPDSFHIYTDWLYGKTTLTDRVSPTIRIRYEHAELADCYIFRETFQDIDFKNAVMRAWIDAFEASSVKCLRVNETEIMYAGTTETSPAWQFLAVIWATEGDGTNYHLTMTPEDFNPDSTKALCMLRLQPVG